MLYRPVMDTFASATTKLMVPYLTWYRDSEAMGQDAFLHRWPDKSLIHPPIPLIQKALNKVEEMGITAIFVCPAWDSSIWWPQLQALLVGTPLVLPPHPVYRPDGQPIGLHLGRLMAFPISGRLSVTRGGGRAYQGRL